MIDINKRFAARMVSNYIYAKHKKHITPSSMSVESMVYDDTQVYVVIAGDYKYMVLGVNDTYAIYLLPANATMYFAIKKVEELKAKQPEKGENL